MKILVANMDLRHFWRGAPLRYNHIILSIAYTNPHYLLIKIGYILIYQMGTSYIALKHSYSQIVRKLLFLFQPLVATTVATA